MKKIYLISAFTLSVFACTTIQDVGIYTKFNLANIGSIKTPVVYVTNDGTGNFNTDGVDDHVEINQALDFVANNVDFTTVYLKGPATYWINNTLYISSNTILEGDSNAVVKLVDQAEWGTSFQPLITQKGTSGNNITIRGFEVDGNRYNQSEPGGDYVYYTLI